MNKFEKIKNDVSGLEECLKNEGVSEKEILETRALYLENKTQPAYDCFVAYQKYMLVKYKMLKRYWDSRWMK